VSDLVLSAIRNNSDKEYFIIEGSYDYLILKQCQIKIMIRKVHNEELHNLHPSTGIIGNKIGGRGEVLCRRNDKLTENFRWQKKLQRSI
jgi:hypothetical protein